MSQKLILSAILSIALLLGSATSANALEIPNFPACANPQGQVIASYPSGTHGIPGDPSSYSGSDTVYSLGNGANTQCLCRENGQGIQTNWLDVSGAAQDEIDVLVTQGWIFIPNGTAWGLSNAPYLAKNSTYTCIGSEGASATNTSSGPSGETSSIDTILNLASTGNTLFILAVLLLGTALLSFGLIPNLKKRN